MKVSSLYKMPFSREANWPELGRLDSAVARIFWRLVLPLSLLPPLMLYLTGPHHGDALVAGLGGKSWVTIAALFFIGELASFALMGWLIKQVADTWHGHIDYRNAYLLAAIAPIPLWLSSLGLLVPSLLFNALVSMVALGLSCGLIYQGVHSLCEVREDVEAAAITQLVFGAGFIVWGLLLSVLLLPMP